MTVDAPGVRLTAAPATVLVVDHERSGAEALAHGIADDPRIASAVPAATAFEALQHLSHSEPDVILLRDDAGGRAVGLLTRITRDHPSIAVLVLSDVDDADHVARLVRAGARGWMSVTVDVAEVCRGIEGVAGGQWWLPRRVLALAVRNVTDQPDAAASGIDSLTCRERQVLDAMAAGMNRAEIAASLSLSVNTVRTHIQHLLVRLGVHNSLEAVSIALRNAPSAAAPATAPPPHPSRGAPSSAR